MSSIKGRESSPRLLTGGLAAGFDERLESMESFMNLIEYIVNQLSQVELGLILFAMLLIMTERKIRDYFAMVMKMHPQVYWVRGILQRLVWGKVMAYGFLLLTFAPLVVRFFVAPQTF
jgi:hypothetical protein